MKIGDWILQWVDTARSATTVPASADGNAAPIQLSYAIHDDDNMAFGDERRRGV